MVVVKVCRSPTSFILLAFLTKFSYAVIEPRFPANVAKGEYVEFNCSANGLHNWFLRVDKGGHAKQFSGSTNSNFSSFTIKADVNATIECLQHYGSYPDDDNTANLFVQGLLDPVSQLQWSRYTDRLSWEPPFTLPGVPINGYKISANNTALKSTQNGTTYLDLRWFDLEHCHTYQFTVAAVNSVGTGKNNSIIETYTNTNIIDSDVKNLTISYLNETSTSFSIFVMAELNKSCDTLPPKVVACIEMIENSTNHYSDVIEEQGTINASVPANANYISTFFIYSIEIGDKHFNTFDVQNMNHSLKGSSICFDFTFMSNSQALGCIINVTNTTGLSVAQINVSRNTTTNTASGCVGVAMGGDYTLIVYDWESDGSVSTDPAVNRSILVPALVETVLIGNNINTQDSIPTTDFIISTSTPSQVNVTSKIKLLCIIFSIVIVIIVLLILLISLLVCCWKHHHTNKLELSNESIWGKVRCLLCLLNRRKSET